MILLDTHALVWWQAGGDRLSARARRSIGEARVVYVSPISCWEVTMLVRRQHIALDRGPMQWVCDLFDDDRIDVAPLTPRVAADAALLGEAGFHGDTADQMLYATARDQGMSLVTKDRMIRQFAQARRDIKTIW